jgi:NADPH:quinone reductase-like Zn-dependent oxidoreductase
MENVSLRDVEDPTVGPREVVVRVEAAALNHLDLWTLTGALDIEHEFPHVLGADGTGEIESVGDEVIGFRPGTPVMINPGLFCGACELCVAGEQSTCTTFRLLGEHVNGTFAEKVKVPATNVFPFPSSLSFIEAASLGVTFITAYRMLFARGGLKPGEWILITGIGGGLALSVLQLAAPVAGRILVTSSSDEKIERALQLGAEAGVNYRNEDVAKWVKRVTYGRGVDLAVDSASGHSLDSCLASLRKGGRLVVSGATAGGRPEINARRLFWNQLSIIGSTMGASTDVADMLRAVGGSGVRPVVDEVFSLDNGVDALRRLESQSQFGKIALKIDHD